MEKQKKKFLIVFFKNTFLKALIGFLILCEILFKPNILNGYELINFDTNLSNCKITSNCILQNWKVDDSEKAFIELIEILENTPRLKIIKKDKYNIKAIATSRIMKFIDDIEIKNLKKDNIIQIKSYSRQGIYDLGVNRRRVETLRFRLIDLYN